MTFNEEIIKTLKNYGVNIDNGLLYLLSLYHNLNTDIIPEIIKKQINITGIIIRDYVEGTVKWTMPLFIDQPMPKQLTSKWDWVHTEYRKLFMDIDPKKGGDKKSCLVKMKTFFSENPEVRKEDILNATKLYLDDFKRGREEITYMQQANYFISKTVKALGTTSYSSRLSMYLELLDKVSNKETNLKNVT
jgi:hypothetical protein